MKILVATKKPFAEVAKRQIRVVIEHAGYEMLMLEDYKDSDEFKAAIAKADALIVRSDNVTSEILSAAKNLRIIVRAGAGYDNLDLQACTDLNIVAMNTPGQNSNAVAELAFGLMLFQARSGFSGRSGSELRGKSLGLHGFGNVGRYMAEIAKGFGMEVYAFDPFVEAGSFTSAGVKAALSLEDLYSKCRYVSLHLPVNTVTRKMIGYALLIRMPQDAVLVNTARKEIIDEGGLLKVFEERKDIRYLSDIEPDNKAEFEEKFPGRFIFTPKKMGAQTEEANLNAGVAAAAQVVDFFKTGNEKFRVNK